MRTLIYQYRDGEETSESEHSVKCMRRYAEEIDSEYVYEHNPKFVTNLGSFSSHYGSFKPIFNDYMSEHYDYVLYVDTDVFPVIGLTENIFDQFKGTTIDIGICEEWNAPEVRTKHTIAGINNMNDERWMKLIESFYNVNLPRTKSGLPRVYNSGVVVYSKPGMLKAKYKFLKFELYTSMIKSAGLPEFYTCDQPYLHAMLEVANMNWTTMDYKWNSSVHFQPGTKDPRPVVDLRNNANFVHVQLAGANKFEPDKMDRVVNQPVEEWNL